MFWYSFISTQEKLCIAIINVKKYKSEHSENISEPNLCLSTYLFYFLINASTKTIHGF